jgi:hypothetical protein
MAGNAWEWVADWYHPQLYQGVRTDPGGPATGIAHVLRGGSWNTLPTNMRVANRMSGLVQGSATGVRCAYGGASDTTTDTPPALNWQTIDGQVARRDGGALEGRALYVSAFAEQDLDNGQPRMGASPVSEISLDPSGASLSFELSVPEGRYMLMAALDDRPPTPPSAAWTPPSASGGVGQQYPVSSGESSLKLFLDAVPTQGHRGPGTP